MEELVSSFLIPQRRFSVAKKSTSEFFYTHGLYSKFFIL